MDTPNTESPMTAWRKANPDKARAHRVQELANRKAKRLANREERQNQLAAQPSPEDKACSQCGKRKPFDAFNKKRRSKDGYRPECRECQHANNERDKDKRQAWHQRNKAKNNAYNRQYHEEHREEIAVRHMANRLKNPEKYQTYGAIYRKENLGYFRFAAHRYRARQRELPDTWTQEQEAFMLDYWHNACAACGNPKGLFWTLAYDHFIPLTDPECPGTVAENMIPLCHGTGSCNTSKYNTDPHTWLVRRFGPKNAAKIEKSIATYFAIVAERFPHAS